MPIAYSINEIDGIVIEVWSSDISISALIEYWREYLKDERVLKMRKTLVDMREAKVTFSADELLSAVKDVVAPALDGRDWVTAIVVKNPDQFHSGARYQAFASFYSHDSLFSDVNSATAWLLKQELKVP